MTHLLGPLLQQSQLIGSLPWRQPRRRRGRRPADAIEQPSSARRWSPRRRPPGLPRPAREEEAAPKACRQGLRPAPEVGWDQGRPQVCICPSAPARHLQTRLPSGSRPRARGGGPWSRWSSRPRSRPRPRPRPRPRRRASASSRAPGAPRRSSRPWSRLWRRPGLGARHRQGQPARRPRRRGRARRPRLQRPTQRCS